MGENFRLGGWGRGVKREQEGKNYRRLNKACIQGRKVDREYTRGKLSKSDKEKRVMDSDTHFTPVVIKYLGHHLKTVTASNETTKYSKSNLSSTSLSRTYTVASIRIIQPQHFNLSQLTVIRADLCTSVSLLDNFSIHQVESLTTRLRNKTD